MGVFAQDPIVINGDRAKIVGSRANILSFYEVDSAGLEQSSSSGAPDTSSRTEGETFGPDRD